MSNLLILGLSLLLFLPGSAFAGVATPYNEWNFSFVTTEIYQDGNHPTIIQIDSQIIYHGQEKFGSVKLHADITEPDGKTKSHSSDFFDLKIGDNVKRKISHHIDKTGIYKVILRITPPSEQFQTHVFDERIFEVNVTS